MDLQKIGTFLAQLRKEQGLTQEQLGEKLWVTNKTVSRWETGAYLPPAEMLVELSGLYGLTINELLSGQRLTEEAYRQAAEENIKAVIKESGFGLEDRIAYFKKKWSREHRAFTVFLFSGAAAAVAAGILLRSPLLCALGSILAIVAHVIRYNAMMTYVEDRAFDGSGRQ